MVFCFILNAKKEIFFGKKLKLVKNKNKKSRRLHIRGCKTINYEKLLFTKMGPDLI